MSVVEPEARGADENGPVARMLRINARGGGEECGQRRERGDTHCEEHEVLWGG